MNTHAEYRRHGYQPPERPDAEAKVAASELARHRDPSLRAQTSGPEIPQGRIAWIRPTDLASYAGPMVGRGIDIHSELVRRARRTPVTASRALRRAAPSNPPTTLNRTEGLQL
ncbi:hypothetical protein [Nocardioides terrisoli]|uniref:hypothetical protein n=1 Tax=Nocardioides terrisoli TaxID=3388267 RepID=UPI00287B6AB1|nr:hypothetical protein [Nocardioides marmorisolisilvae]